MQRSSNSCARTSISAQFHEIPKARADILTASLRANPIFYADSQLIPYGDFSKERPGGPVQYDINISHPLDVSHKRRARTAVASQAGRVIEAQYQDAVRQQIDSLYDTYVGVLARERPLATPRRASPASASSWRRPRD